VIGACSHAGPGVYAAVKPPTIVAVMVAVQLRPVRSRLVSLLVSFTDVRAPSTQTTQNRQPRSRTLLTLAGLRPTDLESELGEPQENHPRQSTVSIRYGNRLSQAAELARYPPETRHPSDLVSV
jgi:hypothetical protein